MTVMDPAIQQQYDQNAASRRAAVAEVASDLKASQQEIAEQIKKDEAGFAALTKQLTESTVDEPAAPVRRPEDNDISANASAYQEAEEENPTPPPPPAPVARRAAVDEEEVPSFQWDDDPPATPPPPAPEPERPARRARPAASQDADEDLSEHDWLE
jgi:hypothetical protein